MHTTAVPRFVRRLTGVASATLLVSILFLGSLPEAAYAVSSWNPTLLVNTESFEQIDAGDGTTDIELRFGSSTNVIKFLNTLQIFQFTKGISVLGTISGSKLAIDGNATISGSLLIKNNIAAKGTVSGSTISGFGLGSCNGTNQKLVFNNATNKFECATDQNTGTGMWSNTGSLQNAFDTRYVNQSGDTMTGALKVRANLSGSTLRVDGAADIHGPLTASGAFRTDSNITINDDADSNDATLTFGNTSGNQTIKFLNTLQLFEFSKGIRVLGTISGSTLRVDHNAVVGGTLTATGAIRTKGNLSGSTLTVDGNVTLHGVTYNAPSAQGSANTFLKNDGAGNLTWSTVGNSSGGIMSMHPDYPGAVYFASGASMVGQLTMSGGTADFDNSYAWTTSRSAMQNYWISVRGRVPDNFSSWDPVKPAEFRYKTGTTGWQNNHLSLKIRDTAGTLFTLTGGLVSTSYAKVNVDPSETTAFSSGVWTPKGYFTVYVKVAATSAANAAAYASYINLNYETTTP